MSILSTFLIFALGFAATICLTPPLIRLCGRYGWGVPVPALHHTHKQPVPRLGGLVLAASFVVVEIAIGIIEPEERALTPHRTTGVVCCLAMFGLGFMDDLKPLGAKRKLVGQVLIALAAWVMGIGIESVKIPFTGTMLELHGWGAVLTIFWLVGITNLINLIDGIDGLAAGISLMLMVLMAAVGGQGGNFGLLATGMTAALMGFLRYNFPPARIYLGDGGAYFIGFQIGVFSLINSHKGTVFAALVAPLFGLALPIVDTVLAIVRRGVHGLPIFRPDRQHVHHRLLRAGLTRRQVVLLSYGLTLVFLVLGLLTVWSQGQFIPLLLGIAVAVLLVCAGQFSFSREWFAVGRAMGNSLEMRQEIQYALAQTRWLELEGRRSRQVLQLWNDLVFVARKLGFSEVKLRLADGERCWRIEPRSAAKWRTSFELHGGRFGNLELSAPEQSAAGAARVDEMGHPLPGICSEHLFDVLSDLLAEAWGKAAGAWMRQAGIHRGLTFEPFPPPGELARRQIGKAQSEQIVRIFEDSCKVASGQPTELRR